MLAANKTFAQRILRVRHPTKSPLPSPQAQKKNNNDAVCCKKFHNQRWCFYASKLKAYVCS